MYKAQIHYTDIAADVECFETEAEARRFARSQIKYTPVDYIEVFDADDKSIAQYFS